MKNYQVAEVTEEEADDVIEEDTSLKRRLEHQIQPNKRRKKSCYWRRQFYVLKMEEKERDADEIFAYPSPNASMLSHSSSIATQGYTSSTED